MACNNCNQNPNATFELQKLGDDIHLGIKIFRCCECENTCNDGVLECFADYPIAPLLVPDCEPAICLDDAPNCSEV